MCSLFIGFEMHTSTPCRKPTYSIESDSRMVQAVQGYGLVAERELQYFYVGAEVKVVGEYLRGYEGELVMIDPHNTDEGDFYGIWLDEVGAEVFFRADELEVLR